MSPLPAPVDDAARGACNGRPVRCRQRSTAIRRTMIGLLVAGTLVAACHRAKPAPVDSATSLVEPFAPLPDALHNAALPESLADSTFWRMVTELSEPGGYFQSENFVSNEMGLQHVIGYLEALTPPGGVYVGVGPEQNFTYLGALRPRIAFVVDIRRQNLLQHLWYKAVFELSPTRAEFLSRLFAPSAWRRDPGGLECGFVDRTVDKHAGRHGVVSTHVH